jgi:hypothetical protein
VIKLKVKLEKANFFWLIIWIIFSIYAFVFAPPSGDETNLLIQKMLSGDISNVNWVTFALFNLMGVWPLLHFSVLASDGNKQPVPWWIFAIGSFFLGAFILLPYFALRRPKPEFEGEYNGIVKLSDGKGLGIALFAISGWLAASAILYGDWSAYAQDFLTTGFIHVMSIDFMVLWAMFVFIAQDDMSRRGISKEDRINKWTPLVSIPIFGAAIYLITRPKLKFQQKNREE